MSAFIHSKGFFETLFVNLTSHGRNSARGSAIYAIGKDLCALHPDVDHTHVREEHEERHIWDFVRSLEAAECYAVAQRYGGEPQDPILPTVPPAKRLPPGNLVSVFKALQSIEYQCTEGDTYSHEAHGKTLATLAKLKTDIAHAIIVTLPSYNEAPWS